MKELNLVKLIVTVFIISWIGVLPSLLIAYGIAIPEALKSLQIFMILGPVLGAVIFIYKAQGKQGLKGLFSRLLIFKTSPLVILVAIALPIILSFLSSFIGFYISETNWPESFSASNIVSNGLMIFAMYMIINTEEIVWRGVVFDRLFTKYGYIKSCLILAPIWGLFHVPLFLYPEGHQAGYGLLEFTFIVASETFILGWIYIKTNRSLVYVHIHHQLFNGFGQAFPIFPIFIGGSFIPIWVMCAFLLFTTIVIVWHSNVHKTFSDNLKPH